MWGSGAVNVERITPPTPPVRQPVCFFEASGEGAMSSLWSAIRGLPPSFLVALNVFHLAVERPL